MHASAHRSLSSRPALLVLLHHRHVRAAFCSGAVKSTSTVSASVKSSTLPWLSPLFAWALPMRGRSLG